MSLLNYINCLLPNPNLLDNTYFKNTINQRAEDHYIQKWGYSIDRWVLVGDYDVPTHTLTFDATNQVSRFGLDAISYMRQGFEKLDSGTYTISAGVGGDKVYSQTISVYQGGSIKAWNMGPFYFTYEKYVGVDVQWFGFGVTPGESSPGSIALDWIKLEKGSMATPYAAKPYIDELNICRMYFIPNFWTTAVKTTGSIYACSTHINMRGEYKVRLLKFSPFGNSDITNMEGCSVSIQSASENPYRSCILYANLPTCSTYSCGGLKLEIDANI